MEPKLTWWILASCLICQVYSDLSMQEMYLLDTDKNPKCFTRDLESFTCFWESTVEKTFYFLYKFEGSEEEIMCDVKQQPFNSQKKKVLNVCQFPPSDVYLFIEIQIRVKDNDTNSTIYRRNVIVNYQLLLYPPSNITLHRTGEVGQMLVKWKPPEHFRGKAEYEIHYHSKTKQNSKELVTGSSHELTSLVPGENCTMQLRVKPAGPGTKGFWSDWSSNITVMVPQSADDIKLRCHTADLQQLLCQWSEEIYEGRYNLHYRQTNSSRSWGSWKLCSKENSIVGQCVLYGEVCNVYEIYISAGFEPFGRIFYMKIFNMSSSIQTKPPRQPWAKIEGGRLCLNWDPSLMMISQHLMYQIQYQLNGDNEWKMFTVTTSKTSTCLDVQKGSEYTVQVKARPDGSTYSGYWSDWSEPLTVFVPSDKEWIFIVCVPLALLIIAVAIIFLFSRSFKTVKQSLWPSVPNLNKVLESILTDINGSHWEPTFNVKQCEDDACTSVVEIVSEAAGTGKPCSPLATKQSFLVGEKMESLEDDLEISQDYVLLKNNTIPSFKGNDYVYRDVDFSQLPVEKLNCSPCANLTTPPESTTNILNHSYLLLLEQPALEEHHSSGRYTNIEITAIACVASGE